MKHETPFQAVLHDTPRLNLRTRLQSLLGATAFALVVAAVIVVAWAWWVGILRDRRVIPPIEVVLGLPEPTPPPPEPRTTPP